VLAYTVAQRQREIGVRVALGAQRRDVLLLVVVQGLKPVLLGGTVGIAVALALTRTIQSLLYGVRPTDPMTFVGVALLLSGVAFLACWVPARRAANTPPMDALRHE
jgi:putative ABC transport system permease protein